MGRFEEWFTDDVSQKQREPDNDSTQTAAPAPVVEDAGSATARDDSPSTEFSVLEDSPSTPDMDSNNTGDHAGGDVQRDPDVAVLPPALSSREQDSTLKTRFNGHSEFNDQIRADWMVIIESSPDAFQALLYRPDVGTYGVVSDETGEESFTELDNNQRALTYQEPVIVSVLDNPDGRESFHAIDADGEQDGLTDDVLILRIATDSAPVGSILEWNEETAKGVARRWWYVHRIYSYGTQHVGSLYYCIPARNFDTTNNGIVE